MKAKRLIIIGVAVLFIIVIWVAFEGKLNPNQSTKIEPVGQGEKFTKPTTTNVTVPAPEGDVILPNFYNDAISESENGSATLLENSDYQFGFNRTTNSFYITIYNEDLEGTIAVAEKAFLSKYKLSESDACKLDVVVRPDILIFPEGKTRALSFCENTQK
jgi:hypothetical protein